MFTVLFSATLLREAPSAWQAAGIVIALGGLALAGFERMGALDGAGLVLVVMAALFWGLGNVVIKRLGKGVEVDGFRLVLWMSLVPPIPNFLLSAWLEEGQLGHLASLSGSGVVALAYTAFASTLFGWGAWAWLLRRYSAPQVAPFSLLVPVLALAMSVAWMGEEFSLPLAMASALLLAGVGVTVCEPWLARLRPATGGQVAAGPR